MGKREKAGNKDKERAQWGGEKAGDKDKERAQGEGERRQAIRIRTALLIHMSKRKGLD